MVAPFCGCAFGGWLYDVLLFTGESPINTPWMGIKRLVRPDLPAIKRELSLQPHRDQKVV